MHAVEYKYLPDLLACLCIYLLFFFFFFLWENKKYINLIPILYGVMKLIQSNQKCKENFRNVGIFTDAQSKLAHSESFLFSKYIR